MKLISCHIENFGTLSNFDFKFDSNITTIIKDNGSGKSTLASFIKAMLYGMESVRTSDKDFKDRVHYAPFNNGIFGGNLVFEHDKGEYRVERIFDNKSEKNDDLKIYLNNEPIIFEKEIGEELLGLDKESFLKLLFIDGDDILIEATGNIKKNLNNILDDTLIGFNYDEIDTKLDKELKKYTTTGQGNLIKNIKSEIKELEEKKKNKEDISLSLNDLYSKRNEEFRELKELREKSKEISEAKAKNILYIEYENKLSKLNEKKNNLNNLCSKYKNGYPTIEELNKLNQIKELKLSIDGKKEEINFSLEKQNELNNYNNKFQKGYPNSDEVKLLEELEKNKKDYIELKNKNVFSNIDLENLKEYDIEFKDGIPDELKIIEIENKITNYNEIKIKLSNNIDKKIDNYDLDLMNNDLSKIESLINNNESKVEISNNKNNPTSLIMAIISIVVILGGVGLIFVNQIIGIIITIIGALLLFISGFLYLKNKIDLNNVPNNSLENKKKELEINNILSKYNIESNNIYLKIEIFKNKIKEINDYNFKKSIEKSDKETFDSLSDEISLFLNQFFKYDDFNSAIAKLKLDIINYQKLNQNYESYEKNNEYYDSLIKDVNNKIDHILDKYNINKTNFELFNLKTDIINYSKLKKENDEYLNKLKSNQSLEKEYLDYLSLIEKKYLISDILNKLVNINNDIKDINRISLEIKNDEDLINTFKIENKLEDTKPEFVIDYDIESKITSLSQMLARSEREIDDFEREIDDLDDVKEKIINLKEELKSLENKYDILKCVEKELSNAQKNLDLKYVMPVKTRFNDYAIKLNKAFNINIEMNKDFNILFNYNSKLRPYKHLSSGERSACAICFRLAILDNIYKSSMLPIIMDDPFMALDDKNLASMKNLINDLALDRQIIYLSCTNNRKI